MRDREDRYDRWRWAWVYGGAAALLALALAVGFWPAVDWLLPAAWAVVLVWVIGCVAALYTIRVPRVPH